jgi:hypothetical protein
MRNKILPIRLLLAMSAMVLIIGMIVSACKKTSVTIPPALTTFVNQTSGVYFITGPNVVDSIPVGVTSVASVDRSVLISVTSPSGATSGNQYTLVSNTITIPANQAIGYIVVKGNFNLYNGTPKKDTLVFTFGNAKTSSLPPSDFNNTFTLVMSGPCFEGDVTLNDLLGDYTNTNENFGGQPFGPYTTSITAVQQLTPTTGTITVSNIFDAGWNPIIFTLDWTDPANRTVTLVQQSGIGDAGTISSTYAGDDISVRPYAGKVGTFSACHQTITLVMQTGVTGLGFFSALYQVNLAR